MHCIACDKLLNEFEIRKIDSQTGDYYDLCGECLKVSNKTISDWGADVDIESDYNYYLTFEDDDGII